MRVVQDGSRIPGTRAGDPKAASGVAQRAGANAVNGAASTGANAGGNAARANAAGGGKALPMLQAGIFLLACLIGGVAVAIVRPF